MSIKKFPEMTWSISRRNMFDSCKRQYYYHFYGSHNAWLAEATEETKWAWRLKKIQNIYMLFGDGLHLAMKKTIQRFRQYNYLIEKAKIQEYINNKLNYAYAYSKYHSNEWMEKPNKYPMLFEIFYDGGLSSKQISEIKLRTGNCIDNFFASNTLAKLMNRDNEILELDEDDFRYITFSNCKLFAILDALFWDKEAEQWVIVDWKTGKEEEKNREQLLLYVFYVIEKYGFHIKDIKVKNEYLLSGNSQEYSFSQDDLAEFKGTIEKSILAMQEFVENAVTNEPKEIEFFSCNPSKKCAYCNFLKLCEAGREYLFSQITDLEKGNFVG